MVVEGGGSINKPRAHQPPNQNRSVSRPGLINRQVAARRDTIGSGYTSTTEPISHEVSTHVTRIWYLFRWQHGRTFLHLHPFLNHGGRWGTTDDLTTSLLQFSLFSIASSTVQAEISQTSQRMSCDRAPLMLELRSRLLRTQSYQRVSLSRSKHPIG